MRTPTLSIIRFATVWSLFLALSILNNIVRAQTESLNIVVQNISTNNVHDYMVEIPAEQFNLTLGNYIASVKEKKVPVEISYSIFGKQSIIIPIDRIMAKEKLEITVTKGIAGDYPKRTYAELSHKIGGEFIGHRYTGGYSWVRTNSLTLPGDFTDHSFYVKYEGPGWENDKVAFRYYLDNRNAIDVFGKTTSDIVLPAVGIDGFDNYHKLADWGMDNLKVGKALGLGSIAIWDGEKAVRVGEKDSTKCLIQADGKLRSQIKTIYYGWEANGIKCNLTSLITIDAGSRASHMELLTDKTIDNITTGINLDDKAELISGERGEWGYIATFGQQSLNKDMQGLSIFYKKKQLKEVTKDKLNHLVVLSLDNGYAEYYFMPTWELEKEPVKTKDDFMKCIHEVLNRLNNNIIYKLK